MHIRCISDNWHRADKIIHVFNTACGCTEKKNENQRAKLFEGTPLDFQNSKAMKNKALENSVGELSLRKPIIDNVNEAVIARCSLLSSREFAKVLRLY